jgi:hypothetical protein
MMRKARKRSSSAPVWYCHCKAGLAPRRRTFHPADAPVKQQLATQAQTLISPRLSDHRKVTDARLDIHELARPRPSAH